MRQALVGSVLLVSLLCSAAASALRGRTLSAAVPTEPVPAILDAFRTHPVVGLGLPHGDARGPAFVVSLVRDPRFAGAVNDLVLEGASGRYQDVMDRYVRGEGVADQLLRHVWDDTTQPQFPGPMWIGQPPAIYRAVRDLNRSLPRGRQVRILLGDPPIDWDKVHTRDDYMKWLEQRDTYPAELIRREVVARGRHALVVYGGGHLQRRNQAANYQMDHPLAQTIVSLLEAAGIRTLIVRTAGDSMTPGQGFEAWPVPSLGIVRGTTLGAADEPHGSLPRMAVRDGRLVPVAREQWITVRLEEQLDAVLYLGPASARRSDPIPGTICADTAYIQARLKRMVLAGLPPVEAERLRAFCGVQAAK